jgi:diguanylate cyclase (GGDEF)-like protein/PAS domain S-box-containing protein
MTSRIEPRRINRDVPPASDRDRRFALDLIEHLVVPAFVLDRAGLVLIWNRACERLTGVAARAVLGTPDHWSGFYRERRPCLADLVLEARLAEIQDRYGTLGKFGLNDFGVAVEDWCDLPQAGRRAYLAIDAGPIYDEAGGILAVVETLRDITAQREAQDALAMLAALDGLTGLANRRTFDQALEADIRRAIRTGSPLSLLLMDIDGFKLFNDTYGHGGGDRCLRRVAQALAGVPNRTGDTVARYGGEEFAVILPETDLADGFAVAERIRRAVEALGIPHIASPVGPVVTISVGVAASCGPALDARELLETADAALYRAKRAGRNRTGLCTPHMAFTGLARSA